MKNQSSRTNCSPNSRNELWRVWEEHGLMAHDQGVWDSLPAAVALQYDLNAGRMLLTNNDKDVPIDFNWRVDVDSYFTPAQVRRGGVR